MPAHWNCPFCNRATTVGTDNITERGFSVDDGNKDGRLYLSTTFVTCPNPQCKEYSIVSTLSTAQVIGSNWGAGEAMQTWNLRPLSTAKPFPAYIPAPILADYTEACLIRSLSPKASATLSRRCLQGMIRDFWGVSKNRLIDEINELKDKVDPDTWGAIDAVRNIGNIGAHMEKDINLVIEVDPSEAQMLIGLIEILLEDWYINRYQRAQHMAGIIAAAQAKKPPLPPK
jgi:hypothetical protein